MLVKQRLHPDAGLLDLQVGPSVALSLQPTSETAHIERNSYQSSLERARLHVRRRLSSYAHQPCRARSRPGRANNIVAHDHLHHPLDALQDVPLHPQLILNLDDHPLEQVVDLGRLADDGGVQVQQDEGDLDRERTEVGVRQVAEEEEEDRR